MIAMQNTKTEADHRDRESLPSRLKFGSDCEQRAFHFIDTTLMLLRVWQAASDTINDLPIVLLNSFSSRFSHYGC